MSEKPNEPDKIWEQIAELKASSASHTEEINTLYDFVHQNVVIKNNNLEAVLRDHLKSHIVVARDQLTDKDKMTIFKEFDEAIEKQLKKLDSKVGSASARESLDRQTEKKEVDITNMVLKRCPYCTELFSLDVNTLVVRGSEASGGDLITIEEAVKQGKIVEKLPEFADMKDYLPEPKAKPEKDHKYPKVVYQLGSDSKEYIELKKKYDKLIEDKYKGI